MAASSKVDSSAKETSPASNAAKFARSEAAQTAQLTLISILLASILGALFIGLPANFTSNVFRQGEWGVDIRVLATFLAAFDLWIEYAWSTISRSWAFAMRHNVTYFLVTGALIGLALSVSQNGSWLAWGAVVGFTSTLAALVNAFWPIQARLRDLRYGISAQSSNIRDKAQRLQTFRKIVIGQIVLYALSGLILLYAAFDANGVLPLAQTIGWPPIVWAIFFLVMVIADLVIYAHWGMPRESEIADLMYDQAAPVSNT